MEKQPIIKIVTKEKFLQARKSGNYKTVSPDAERVIDQAHSLDLLELTTQMNSTLSVVAAKKLDETRFVEIMCGASGLGCK